jgi:hypothetical protein
MTAFFGSAANRLGRDRLSMDNNARTQVCRAMFVASPGKLREVICGVSYCRTGTTDGKH